VLAAARGFKVTEVPVNHRARPFGTSRYGWGRIPRGLLDLATVRFLTGFGQRPQHLLGIAGLLGFCLGGLGLLGLVAWWFVSRSAWAAAVWPDVTPIHLHTRPVFYLSLAAMILGAQLTSMGFLAELFVAFQRRDPATYSVCETAGDPPRTIYSIRRDDRRARH
ncbi:MAG: glycosyltransferase, partial [Planctomycetota bacterium]